MMSHVFAPRLWILLGSLLLWACSGATTPGGVAGPGGAVGGGAPPGAGAAQPMDSGFSGPKKDIENIHYILREARARLICEAGEGQAKVRIEGRLGSRLPSGEIYDATGFLRIADAAGGRFLVTRTSMDVEHMGRIRTELKASLPLQLSFEYKQGFDGPLDTLLPNESSGGLSIVIPVEADPELLVEEAAGADLPCVEKTFQLEVSK